MFIFNNHHGVHSVMTIKVTTPTNGGDSVEFGSGITPIAAEVTGSEVSSGEGKLEFKTTTGGTSATKVTVLANGNVGIGTSSPINKLAVSGSVSLLQSYGTYLANSYYSGSWKYVGNGSAWGIGDNFGGPANGTTIAIAAVNAGGAGAALTWNPVFSIDSTGNLKFNSGYGSAATAYGCRAWVNFNGTGTVAIRASGNVSSITDNGTGNYTVNFTVAMSDANYTAVTGGGIDSYGIASNVRQGPASSNASSSACRISCGFDNGSFTDWVYVAVAIFR